MGCGTSANAVGSQDNPANGHAKANGNGAGHGHDDNGHDGNGHDDGLPTVVLPETPVKPKPPVAFEIPLDEFEGAKHASSPPPHLQRLLQPPQPEISLPDIKEKLAEAELRRHSILQQRAASAQKRTMKMIKSGREMDRLEAEHEHADTLKHGSSTLTIPPEPGVCEDKHIS